MAPAAGRAGWRLAHRVGCGPDSATADKVFACGNGAGLGRSPRLCGCDGVVKCEAEGLDDAVRAVDCHAVVVVPFVTGDLRFVHFEAFGELPLGQPADNSQADQDLAEVRRLGALTTRIVRPNAVSRSAPAGAESL